MRYCAACLFIFFAISFFVLLIYDLLLTVPFTVSFSRARVSVSDIFFQESILSISPRSVYAFPCLRISFFDLFLSRLVVRYFFLSSTLIHSFWYYIIYRYEPKCSYSTVSFCDVSVCAYNCISCVRVLLIASVIGVPL